MLFRIPITCIALLCIAALENVWLVFGNFQQILVKLMNFVSKEEINGHLAMYLTKNFARTLNYIHVSTYMYKIILVPFLKYHRAKIMKWSQLSLANHHTQRLSKHSGTKN